MAQNKKILLGLMPFWDPLIPPNGIASLKTYLLNFGYEVKTIDFTTKPELLIFYNNYFKVLKNSIPKTHHGNLFNSGHDAMERHLLAHINCKDREKMNDIVYSLVYNTYFYKLSKDQIQELVNIIEEFYLKLEEALSVEIDNFKPDVFGLTVYKNILGPSLFAYKYIKKRLPSVLTVFGGTIFADSHAVGSPNYNILINDTKDCIDKIIIGPGEKLFLSLLRNEFPEDMRVINIHNVEIEPLNYEETGLPDYSEFDISRYPYLPITGSNGCPFKCMFCNSTLYWGKFRKKNAELTVKEMKQFNEKYNRQLFFMTDSMINPIIEKLSEKLNTDEHSFYYDGYFKIDKASGNINNTLKWRKSGFYRARIGVESGSQKVLDLMDKRITIEQIRNSLTSLAFAGIKTTTYWVFGYPGETEEDFQESLDFVEEMKDEIWQIEPAPFMYQYSGQVNSSNWESKRTLVYPEEYTKYMMSTTWKLEQYPSREEAFNRTQRFIDHCRKLGIPNPYSIQEHYDADVRWKKLHPNAVPSLIEFRDSENYITENKDILIPTNSTHEREEVGDFNF